MTGAQCNNFGLAIEFETGQCSCRYQDIFGGGISGTTAIDPSGTGSAENAMKFL